MKLITAIIKPFKLDDVLDGLTKAGITGLTATEVKGYGQQKGQIEKSRDTGHSVNFLPKVKLEIAVSDEKSDKIIKIIKDTAATGKIGDGKIFVTNLEKVVRIRTGEEDKKAV